MPTLRRLRLLLTGFVLALALPGAVLVYHAYSQLKWQAFFAARLKAQGASERIDQAFAQKVLRQVKVPMDSVNQQRASLDRSGASTGGVVTLPKAALDGGLLGLFEVDAQGRLRGPDDSMSLGRRRSARLQELQRVLLNNQLIAPPAGRVTAAPAERRENYREQVSGSRSRPATDRLAERTARAPAAAVQPGAASGFDRLADDEVQQTAARRQANYGQVADLKLDQSLDKQAAVQQKKSGLVTGDADEVPTSSRPPNAEAEQVALAEPAASLGAEEADFAAITAFRRDVERFQFSLLDSGHFVLFRNVWRPEGRVVQGALYSSETLLSELRQEIDAAALDGVEVLVAYGGTVLEVVGSGLRPDGRIAAQYDQSAPVRRASGTDRYSLTSQAAGQLLYRSRLSPPLSAMELVYYAEQLPLGAGLNLLLWLSLTLALVLFGGAWALYRLGLGQLQLARQQRDFVSAVSHELKTPLTSIRMYGEMLASGLAPAERQPQYFAYIHEESERLSRLIDNVLQLARFDRGEVAFKPTPVTVSELLDLVQSRIASQVSAAGFELLIDAGDAGPSQLLVDPDAMLQLFINLTDNALKFSRGGERQRIEIGARRGKSSVLLWVRDFGPGVSQDQIGKIFRLFYRTESELTRDTIGTGIGLSLVQQIVTAMGGSVDVVNGAPGARFEVTLPVVS